MAKQGAKRHPHPDPIRVRQLREDAKRPMGVNLSEGIALSHTLMRFVGAARAR
ncbi:MAG: hypothetical protein H0V29_09790 [Thermoleophilaceae bacterium]|nr:hypothetical protein [Thermoleophilaceae bacterium]